jgi:hypothetical protein
MTRYFNKKNKTTYQVATNFAEYVALTYIVEAENGIENPSDEVYENAKKTWKELSEDLVKENKYNAIWYDNDELRTAILEINDDFSKL